jgi:hypothetical protein
MILCGGVIAGHSGLRLDIQLLHVCIIFYLYNMELDVCQDKEKGVFINPPFSYNYAAIPNDFSKIFGSYEISTTLFGRD